MGFNNTHVVMGIEILLENHDSEKSFISEFSFHTVKLYKSDAQNREIFQSNN